MSAHPTLRRKAEAIVAVFKPGVTVEQVERLTRDQWQRLAERAGVGSPTPLVQGMVRDEVARMRAVIDGGNDGD